MTNIDIASALRIRGWKTELLVDGELKAIYENISLTRKEGYLKVLIQQRQTIRVEYRPESHLNRLIDL